MNNELVYQGRTCRICGSTTRYKSSKRCYHCKQIANSENYRKDKILKRLESAYQ